MQMQHLRYNSLISFEKSKPFKFLPVFQARKVNEADGLLFRATSVWNKESVRSKENEWPFIEKYAFPATRNVSREASSGNGCIILHPALCRLRCARKNALWRTRCEYRLALITSFERWTHPKIHVTTMLDDVERRKKMKGSDHLFPFTTQIRAVMSFFYSS